MTVLSDVELFPVRIPLRVRFRRVTWREAVLIRGPAGWGEFSPFPDYPPEVTVRWLAAALESACIPWPEPVRDRIPVNVTVPAVDPDTAGEMVRESGCSTAKIKVAEPGEDFADDLARVEAARRALGEDGRVRVDANAAWTVDEAASKLAELDRFHLEYAEQPVRTIEELVALRPQTNVPLAADEVVRLGPDPIAVVASGAVDLVVLKAQPLGGVHRALDIARRAGIPVVISSALETSVGVAAGIALAAAVDRLPYACGLGTVSLLEGDVTTSPLLPEDGFIEVRRPQPDPDLIRHWMADRETESNLMRRLRQAAELLT